MTEDFGGSGGHTESAAQVYEAWVLRTQQGEAESFEELLEAFPQYRSSLERVARAMQGLDRVLPPGASESGEPGDDDVEDAPQDADARAGADRRP